ncbi:MAG: AarF/UbiB family protein, partial [Actinomycetota bacterium]
AGARPGPKLQVHFKGTENLEHQIRRAGRRVSLGLISGGALVGAAVAALGTLPGWVPGILGALGGALALGLVVDVLRRGR